MKRFAFAAAFALLAWPVLAQPQPPNPPPTAYQPPSTTAPAPLAVSGTTARVALTATPSIYPAVTIINDTTVAVYCNLGDVTVTASTTVYQLYIPAGAKWTTFDGKSTYVACITGGTSGTVHVTQSNGSPQLGMGGNGTGGGGGTPGGSNTQVQYNNNGVFGGVSGVISNGTSMQFADNDLLVENAANTGGVGLHAGSGSGHSDVTFPTGTNNLLGSANNLSDVGSAPTSLANIGGAPFPTAFYITGAAAPTAAQVNLGITYFVGANATITLPVSGSWASGVTMQVVALPSVVATIQPNAADNVNGGTTGAALALNAGQLSTVGFKSGEITVNNQSSGGAVSSVFGRTGAVVAASNDYSIGQISGLGTGIATFLGTPSSANLASAMTDETGSGALFFAGGNAGVFSGTSLALNGCTIGTDGLCITGTATISGAVSVGNANFTSSTIPANGVYLSNTNTPGLSSNGSLRFIWSANLFSSSNATGAGIENVASTATVATLLPDHAATTSGLGGIANVPCLIVSSVCQQKWDGTGFFALGTIPTVTGTGTPTITTGSTDTAGEVTSGATAVSVVITFSATKTNAPFCAVTPQTQLATFAYTISTTAITITQAATSGEKIDYACFQH